MTPVKLLDKRIKWRIQISTIQIKYTIINLELAEPLAIKTRNL